LSALVWCLINFYLRKSRALSNQGELQNAPELVYTAYASDVPIARPNKEQENNRLIGSDTGCSSWSANGAQHLFPWLELIHIPAANFERKFYLERARTGRVPVCALARVRVKSIKKCKMCRYTFKIAAKHESCHVPYKRDAFLSLRDSHRVSEFARPIKADAACFVVQVHGCRIWIICTYERAGGSHVK
jgi:hypothetical protein